MSEIFILRHGQSEFNAGNLDVYDAALTELGRKQVSEVSGHFDFVLCCPLTRAKQTLHFSKITYDKLEVMSDARERKKDKSDFFPCEEMKTESIEELIQRVQRLKTDLQSYRKTYTRILVVGHWWIFKFLTSTNCDDVLSGKCMTGNGVNMKNCEMTKVTL